MNELISRAEAQPAAAFPESSADPQAESTSDEPPLLCSTALNIARFAGRYLRIMQVYQTPPEIRRYAGDFAKSGDIMQVQQTPTFALT